MGFDCFSDNKEDKISKIWIRRPSEKCTPLPVRVEKAGYAVWGKISSFRRNRMHKEFTIEYVSEGSKEALKFSLREKNIRPVWERYTFFPRGKNTFTGPDLMV